MLFRSTGAVANVEVAETASEVPVPRTGGRGVTISPGKGQREPTAQMRPERQQPPISEGQAVKDARPLHGKPV